MLLGRLAIHLEAEDLLLVRPNLITKLFLVRFTPNFRASFLESDLLLWLRHPT